MLNSVRFAIVLIAAFMIVGCDNHQSTSKPNEHQTLDQTIKEVNSTQRITAIMEGDGQALRSEVSR